jgi:outer membrane protein
MTVRLACLVVVVAARLAAQNAAFPSGTYFREQWTKPPLQVELPAPIRLEDFVVGGKLELSLRSYIELVMANNTDIAIQRLNVLLAQNAIQRAFAPFDPAFLGSFNSSRANTPSNDVLAGASVVSSLNQRASFTYNQMLENGTQYNVGFIGNKAASNSAFTNFNPSISTNLQFNVTQPLLRNRGIYVNRLPIMIARSRFRASGSQLREQVISLLAQAESAYWDVVDARESLRVRQESLELAQTFLKRSTRELELGAISPLDIYQPQQQQATAEVNVATAVYRLKQREDAARRWIGADLNPQIRTLPLVLTETATAPVDSAPLLPEDLAERALRLRPELETSRFTTDAADLQIQSATNNLRPDLSLGGTYTSQGRGGIFFPRSLTGTTGPVIPLPGGINDAIDQLFNFTYPTYGFSLTLRLPLRNRQAAADLADATVTKRREILNQRSLEQRIRLDVLTAVNAVEQSRAGVRLAGVAQEFARKRLDAEQRKYELGVSTIFLVLQAQTDLTSAESDLVTQSINLRRNQLQLLQSTGELIEERGVVLQ